MVAVEALETTHYSKVALLEWVVAIIYWFAWVVAITYWFAWVVT